MMFKRWVVGCQLGVALLAMSAGVPAMSGAATAPASKTPTSTTPNVSSVTVTVPGSATVTSPAVKPRTTVTSAPVTTRSTPASTTAPAPATPTPASTTTTTTSTTTATASTSVAAGGSSATPASTRSHRNAVLTQPKLRGDVVALSSCLSRLPARSRRMLLLRAAVITSAPASRLAVARALRVGVAREPVLERAALRALRRAARRNSCGRPPMWIHVPARDRLVLVDPVLTGKSAA